MWQGSWTKSGYVQIIPCQKIRCSIILSIENCSESSPIIAFQNGTAKIVNTKIQPCFRNSLNSMTGIKVLSASTLKKVDHGKAELSKFLRPFCQWGISPQTGRTSIQFPPISISSFFSGNGYREGSRNILQRKYQIKLIPKTFVLMWIIKHFRIYKYCEDVKIFITHKHHNYKFQYNNNSKYKYRTESLRYC